MEKIRQYATFLRNLLSWFAPFFLFLLVTFVAVLFLHGTIAVYTDLVKALVWPVTALIALFFFRKVFTYLFFSITEFNFFGTKGELKNVGDLIREEVDKKYAAEERARAQQKEVAEYQKLIQDASDDAQESMKLATEVLDNWKETVKNLEDANTKLSDMHDQNEKLMQENTLYKELFADGQDKK